jgi:hypothetical protein
MFQCYLMSHREVVRTHHTQPSFADVDEVSLKYFIVQEMAQRIFYFIVGEFIAFVASDIKHSLNPPTEMDVSNLFRATLHNELYTKVSELSTLDVRKKLKVEIFNAQHDEVPPCTC